MFAASTWAAFEDDDDFALRDFERVWSDLQPLDPADHQLFHPPSPDTTMNAAIESSVSPLVALSPTLDSEPDPMLSSTAAWPELDLVLAPLSESSPMELADSVIHYPPGEASDAEVSEPEDGDEEPAEGTPSALDDHDYLGPELQLGGGRRRRARRKPLAHAWSQMKRSGTLVEEKPLYEQASFQDPILERCRKNALGAKLNRERKKQEQARFRHELQELRAHNRSLAQRARQSDERARQAELALARMSRLLEQRQLSDVVQLSVCAKRHTSVRSRADCGVCSQDSEE